jgi:hypothetical protein
MITLQIAWLIIYEKEKLQNAKETQRRQKRGLGPVRQSFTITVTRDIKYK